MTKHIVVGVLTAGGIMLGLAGPALAENRGSPASSTGVSTAKIACVGAAVAAREATLGAAEQKLTGATNAAYSARARSLSDAYAQTEGAKVKASVKLAWSQFRNSLKTAQKDWKTSKTGAWKQFRTAEKACRAPATVSDGGNEGAEVSGM